MNANSLNSDDYYRCTQLNAHQSGILNRASRELIQSDTLAEANTVLTSTLNELHLSGCFQVFWGSDRAFSKFGDGIQKSECHELFKIRKSGQKIIWVDDYFVFNTHCLYLVANLKGQEPVAVDLLKDNITIFCDSFGAWVQLHHDKAIEREISTLEKLKAADKMNEILNCLTRLNTHLIEGNRQIFQNLLSGLVSQFPRLALEGDQEDAILDIIELAKDRQQANLSAQIQYNDDLKTVLSEAIGTLVTNIDAPFTSTPDKHQSNIRSIELF